MSHTWCKYDGPNNSSFSYRFHNNLDLTVQNFSSKNIYDEQTQKYELRITVYDSKVTSWTYTNGIIKFYNIEGNKIEGQVKFIDGYNEKKFTVLGEKEFQLSQCSEEVEQKL